MTKRLKWYEPRGKPRADRGRGTTTERGYGTQWQKLRQLQLNREPLCEECKAAGRTKEGEHVDHIVPLSEGGQHELLNLQTLCAACHGRKTAADRRRRGGIGGAKS